MDALSSEIVAMLNELFAFALYHFANLELFSSLRIRGECLASNFSVFIVSPPVRLIRMVLCVCSVLNLSRSTS